MALQYGLLHTNPHSWSIVIGIDHVVKEFNHHLDAEWHVVAPSNHMNTIPRTIAVPAPLDPPYITLVEHSATHLGQLCADRARTWYQQCPNLLAQYSQINGIFPDRPISDG